MYTELAEIPVPIGGTIIPGSSPGSESIELLFSIRDHELNTKSTWIKHVVHNGKFVKSLPSQVDDSQIASLYSPSGAKRVVLRETKDKKRRVVELWKGTLKESSIDVTDNHQSFYADDYLGGLSFNATEDAVVYTAEGNHDDKDPLAKFRYRPDFGEGLSGKRRPANFVVCWPADRSTKPQLYRLKVPLHPDVRFGQFVFSHPVEDAPFIVLYATGYELQPDGRLLGVKGCFNRPSGIWRIQGFIESAGAAESTGDKSKVPIEVECTGTKLTPSSISCRSPRVVPGSPERIVFLGCPSGGPHVTASTLYSWHPSSALVALGDTEKHAKYPNYNLPISCFLSDIPGGALVYHTHVPGSKTQITLERLDSSKPIRLDQLVEPTDDDKQQLYSWSVLGTDGKSKIICWRSTPSIPYEIVLLDVKIGALVDAVSSYSLDKPSLSETVSKALASVRITIETINSESKVPVETIVIRSAGPESPTDGVVPPCILVPHGGPHGTTTTAFSAGTTALVLAGYTLALPNYTGSLGYGDDFVYGLVGKCGRTDVDECMQSLDNLVAKGIAQEGPGKLFVMGGSHGGFLAAHLIGQFPDRFSAAAMRNPVISVGETSTTDIPDWYFSEFGFEYPVYSSQSQAELSSQQPAPSAIPPLMTAPTFTQLQQSSPIRYIDAVKTPVLLMIGLADRRVAPTHGIEYYHALKARKREVDMLTFEGESHPLDGVECARVCWEACRDFFAAKSSV